MKKSTKTSIVCAIASLSYGHLLAQSDLNLYLQDFNDLPKTPEASTFINVISLDETDTHSVVGLISESQDHMGVTDLTSIHYTQTQNPAKTIIRETFGEKLRPQYCDAFPKPEVNLEPKEGEPELTDKEKARKIKRSYDRDCKKQVSKMFERVMFMRTSTKILTVKSDTKKSLSAYVPSLLDSSKVLKYTFSF